LVSSCTEKGREERENEQLSGIWRGIIRMQGQDLPFNFILKGTRKNLQMEIYNAGEVQEVQDLSWKGDTLIIPMHIFDTEIQAPCSPPQATTATWKAACTTISNFY
jgi:hypothetical protein